MISNVQEKELDLENSVLIVKVYNLILVLHIDAIAIQLAHPCLMGRFCSQLKQAQLSLLWLLLSRGTNPL